MSFSVHPHSLAQSGGCCYLSAASEQRSESFDLSPLFQTLPITQLSLIMSACAKKFICTPFTKLFFPRILFFSHTYRTEANTMVSTHTTPACRLLSPPTCACHRSRLPKRTFSSNGCYNLFSLSTTLSPGLE